MAEDTTTARHLASTQPNSLLHRLPIELQEMIFAFAVVSPTPIPARVHLKDVETPSDNVDSDDTSNADSGRADFNDNTSNTAFTTRVKIEPSQPALSRVDKQTRPIVLRIFYMQNTFLFRSHTYQSNPLHKWLTATEHDYAPEARMMRHVMLEMTVSKTCGAAATTMLMGSNPRGRVGEQHLYRVLVAEQPSTSAEGVRVRFGADLAAMCSCAMRTAGQLKVLPQLGIFHVQESRISLALSFAQDVEYEMVLMPNCTWQFCDVKNSSACRDCGLRVHRGEPLGASLLDNTRKALQFEAELREREEVREAERLERERARVEALQEAERLESEREKAKEQAESAARWEVSKGELDASLETMKAALEEIQTGKMQGLEGKPPAESRCVNM